jgi:transposase-like protein
MIVCPICESSDTLQVSTADIMMLAEYECMDCGEFFVDYTTSSTPDAKPSSNE